jgi:hypothetical protein
MLDFSNNVHADRCAKVASPDFGVSWRRPELLRRPREGFHMTLEDSPKKALAAYVADLSVYYAWYERKHIANRRMWIVGQGFVLLAGVLASATAAAAAADEAIFGHPAVRSALIVLPILSALASALLSQTRVRELMTLRERGREQIQRLMSQARADFAAHASNPVKLTELHRALIASVSAVEREQGRIYNLTAPGGESIASRLRAIDVPQEKPTPEVGDGATGSDERGRGPEERAPDLTG